MSILIKSVHITEYQQATWGRVYVQYEKNGQLFFVFKNWIKFNEKTYKGIDSLEDEPAYNWFEPNKRHIFTNYKDVLNGCADHLYLTPERHKVEFGTPSIILKQLLIELKANIGEPVENRRGWFLKEQNNEIIISNIIVNEKNKILFPVYDTELKLEPMLKLVYLFFLKQNQGIKFIEIPDYKNELLKIYQKISTSSDNLKIQKRIDELTDLTSNSLHEKISKVNKKIKTELGDILSQYYMIKGEPTQPYKINLSKDLITFK